MSTPKCARPGCPYKIYSGEVCKPHFEADRIKGYRGFVDATPAIEHARALRALGWADTMIAAEAGIDRGQVYHLIRGRKRAHVLTVRAVLQVPLKLVPSTLVIDSTGTRRRAQAMAYMGHSFAAQAEALGLYKTTVHDSLSRDRVTAALAYKVAALYEKWQHEPGPSHVAAGKARAAGYRPPEAWDSVTIDDPAAMPADLLAEDHEADWVVVRRILAGAMDKSHERYDPTLNANRADRVAAVCELLGRADTTEYKIQRLLGTGRWKTLGLIADPNQPDPLFREWARRELELAKLSAAARREQAADVVQFPDRSGRVQDNTEEAA